MSVDKYCDRLGIVVLSATIDANVWRPLEQWLKQADNVVTEQCTFQVCFGVLDGVEAVEHLNVFFPDQQFLRFRTCDVFEEGIAIFPIHLGRGPSISLRNL